MRPVTLEFTGGLGLSHDLVHSINDGWCIAPCVIATEQIATQTLCDKPLCRLEYLRLSPAEAVNALLRVAHQKHARRLPRTGVTRQPGTQGLPLQRVGVLKLVDQQVAHAGVQALLHPTAKHRVRHQRQGCALQVTHVQPTALVFELRIILRQQTGQPCHAQLMQPGLVLCLGLGDLDQTVLSPAHGFYAGHFVAELAWRTFLREQRVLGTGHIARGNSAFKMVGSVNAGLERGSAQQAGSVHQQFAHAWAFQ